MTHLRREAGKERRMEFDLKMQQYVDWKVYNVTKIKSGYGYRVVLSYMDGTEMA